MNSLNYLAVGNNGYFQNDNIVILKEIKDTRGLVSDELITEGDEKGWYDQELDVFDISPSLLFTAINNAYSSGFGLYIPLDMSIEKFAKYIATSLSNKETPTFNGANLIDFEYLNKTGKIKSTQVWNKNAAKCGYVWIHNYYALHTIQSIVYTCRQFQQNLLMNKVYLE